MTLSKPEFDFSQYVDVPEAWIEKALRIPNAPQAKPKVISFPKRTVAAASVVLVAVLGVSIYFLIGNKTPIPVAPKTPVSATEILSEVPSFPASPTESGTVPGTTAETQKPTLASAQPATQIATDSRGNIIITTVTTRTGSTENTPATPASQPSTQAPPVQQPTASPAAITSASTVKPTEHIHDAPTEAPSWFVENPSVIEWENPSESSYPVELVAHISDRVRLNEPYVYCRITSDSGEMIGDPNLFSEQHRAPVSRYSVYVGYVPAEYGLTLSRGSYRYYFYESNGETFAEGTFTVG